MVSTGGLGWQKNFLIAHLFTLGGQSSESEREFLGGGNAKRLTFLSFVLSLYLRQVAEKANIGMYKMSEGRYAILVNDMGGETKSKRTKARCFL